MLAPVAETPVLPKRCTPGLGRSYPVGQHEPTLPQNISPCNHASYFLCKPHPPLSAPHLLSFRVCARLSPHMAQRTRYVRLSVIPLCSKIVTTRCKANEPLRFLNCFAPSPTNTLHQQTNCRHTKYAGNALSIDLPPQTSSKNSKNSGANTTYPTAGTPSKLETPPCVPPRFPANK